MIGGHRVAEQQQRACAGDIACRQGRQLEEWRARDVARWRPVVDRATTCLDGIPQLLVGADVGVATAESFRIECQGEQRLDFFRRWPDVAQKNRLAIGADAQCFAVEIDVDSPGNGESHHQRR